MKIKVVAIVGPTAVGKSDFAVQFAKENNGEIISADSRQVYKGMDIGTGKITPAEMQNIPHHLLDVADPRDISMENTNEIFNVEKFKNLAQQAIKEISSMGKLPIICGGTGFYIDAVLNNLVFPDVPHDEVLRKELSSKNVEEIHAELKKLDPDFANKMNNSERNNKQRLIRFVEIASALGKVPQIAQNPEYEVKWIGLNMPYEKLKERIHARLIKRLENGMIEEVENLHKQGVSWERMESFGLEYRYISRYLQGKISKEEMLRELELEICHYAKRQLVWFKRNKQIEWINV